MISETVNKIGASPTLKISAKAKSMKAEGIDVIDLSVGEPDFPTPENVKEAGIKAIRENFTKYTENTGIADLRKAIALRLKDDYGLTYAPNEIIVSAGAKSSLYHLVQALVTGRGGHHPLLLGDLQCVAWRNPARHRPDAGGRLPADARQLKAAISPATKASSEQSLQSDRRGLRAAPPQTLAEVAQARTCASSPTKLRQAHLTGSCTASPPGQDIKKKTIISTASPRPIP
jgi:hypothetical protein